VTLPSVLFGAGCALLIGALYHLWADGGLGRLVLYSILSAGGFVAGQRLCGALNWSLLPVGPLDLGFGSLGSMLFLIVGRWLSMLRVQRPQGGHKV
jgi:hypothetical protein